jgi:iron complex outermembrane receptor protein
MFKRILLLTCASGAVSMVASGAFAATATATADAQAQSSATNVGELVVMAEKREQNLQTVAIAISAFSSAKRDAVGINTIQDMTNFTPGLTYSTSTDRITLRGVGRTTNVLSADAPVANYDDGLYETFAVAAGRSSLDLATVQVERGPQGTLGGRNALAGALDEITNKPTAEPHAEARITLGNYRHVTAEAEVKGPINDVWQYRLYANYDYQGQGWIKNVVPGQVSEGNNINEWYVDFQIQAHFNDHLDMWTKFQSAQWWNPSGGPGDQSAGWTPVGYPSYEFGVAGTRVLAGVACAPGFLGSNVVNVSPAGCHNPALDSPWTEAMSLDHSVKLPAYYSINTQWTWHADGFDIKYIGGGTYYHYILNGPTGGNDAPITSFNLPCSFIPNCGTAGLNVHPTDSFQYEESNGFWSDELNFISTGAGPLQWVAGVYQFYQSYQQPVTAENLEQPQLNGPFGVPSILCGKTGGVCAPETLYRWFDNRPALHDQSYAGYGQIDWKFTPDFKLTLGMRYSYDTKYGTERVRLTCFGLPACYTVPELNPFLGPGGLPVVDLTQVGTVVDSGIDPVTGKPKLPTGVTGPTTYNKYIGLARRDYNASWSSPSGTAGLEWTPDPNSVYYFKYGRGYKSGGYNIGIFTVLSFEPYTAAEHVNSFEIGAKHTFNHFVTVNAAAFYYDYSDLQIPLATIQTAGGLSQSETAFYNVPKSVSRGIELETTWTPMDHLTVLFNYSFLDSYITKGTGADPADPNAMGPNAKPLFSAAQCLATIASAHPDCTVDVYTLTQAQADAVAKATGIPVSVAHANTIFGGVIPGDARQGWNVPQNLAGNPLPNAPRNKIAINVLYDFKMDDGSKWVPSISYVWRDQEYGLFFKEHYYASPAWDQWDARLSYTSPNGKLVIIGFVKNLTDNIGYDQGALGFRAAGTVDVPGGPAGFTQYNYVQGLNGPVGFNNHLAGTDANGVYSTYYVTPPRTWGVEFHYKFY